MTKLEIRNQIRKNELEIAGVMDTVKVEKREATEVEAQTLKNLKEDNTDLQKQLAELDKQEVRGFLVIKEAKKPFSLLRAINNAVEGRSQDDSIMDVLEEGKSEFVKGGISYRGLTLPTNHLEQRTMLAGTAGSGAEIVGTDILALLPFLRANLVLAKAGATILSGLVGNIQVPILGTGSTATWKAENAAATAAGQGFSDITLSPKKITAYYDVSRTFLQQDSVQAEAMLQKDLLASVLDLLESTVLGTANISSTQPAGLFYTPTYAFTGTSTFAGIISMETAVTAANALKNGATYLFHPSTIGVLKGTQKATYSSAFIAENSLVNGYPYYTTTNLPTVLSTKKAAIFGDFSNLLIGQWGGLDLLIDPYSQSLYGYVRVVVNFNVDAKARRGTVGFGKAALS